MATLKDKIKKQGKEKKENDRIRETLNSAFFQTQDNKPNSQPRKVKMSEVRDNGRFSMGVARDELRRISSYGNTDGKERSNRMNRRKK